MTTTIGDFVSFPGSAGGAAVGFCGVVVVEAGADADSVGLCGGADLGSAGGPLFGTAATTGSVGATGGGAAGRGEAVGVLVFEAGVGGAGIFGGPPLVTGFEAVFSTVTVTGGASVDGGASGVRGRDGALVGAEAGVGESGRSKLAVRAAIPFLAPVFTSCLGLIGVESSFDPPEFAKAIFSAMAADVVGATEKRR